MISSHKLPSVDHSSTINALRYNDCSLFLWIGQNKVMNATKITIKLNNILLIYNVEFYEIINYRILTSNVHCIKKLDKKNKDQ